MKGADKLKEGFCQACVAWRTPEVADRYWRAKWSVALVVAETRSSVRPCCNCFLFLFYLSTRSTLY